MKKITSNTGAVEERARVYINSRPFEDFLNHFYNFTQPKEKLPLSSSELSMGGRYMCIHNFILIECRMLSHANTSHQHSISVLNIAGVNYQFR